MSAVLKALSPGFEDPVICAQACFRGVLQAMSHPGRAVELRGPSAPPLLQPATAALLLTLLDADTSLYLHGRLHGPPTLGWLRFHTGSAIAGDAARATFAAVCADELDAALWQALPLGSDDVPQDGATLIVELPQRLDAAVGAAHHQLRLRGPGVDGERLLDVTGLPAPFWLHRIALQAGFPRGIDLLLVRGRELIALPRSTQLAMER